MVYKPWGRNGEKKSVAWKKILSHML